MFSVSTPRDLAIPQVYLHWESPHAIEKLSPKWHISRSGGSGDVSVPNYGSISGPRRALDLGLIGLNKIMGAREAVPHS